MSNSVVLGMLPESRTCLKCAEVKPLDEFSRAPRGKYGRKARCKACDADRHAALHPPVPRVGKPRREPFTPDTLKTCTKCGETKPVVMFSLIRRATETRNAVYRPSCKVCQSAATLKWFADNPERVAAAKIRQRDRFYRLAPGEYDKRLADQGGVCAICGEVETTERQGVVMQLSIDHCHDTGRVRGLLCNRCNRAIGLLGDNPDLLHKAIGYLGG